MVEQVLSLCIKYCDLVKIIVLSKTAFASQNPGLLDASIFDITEVIHHTTKYFLP